MILKQSIRIVKRLITSNQIRAARSLLRWTADDLAERSGVGIATIRRFEVQEGVPDGQIRILDILRNTLEQAGIEFLGAPDNKPGVRLSFPSKD